MSEIADKVKGFLTDAGFEVYQSPGPFAFVAQNLSVLVFVVEAGPDLQAKIRSTVNLLAGPFRSKMFGPKTMEMYCIFISETNVSTPTIEQTEQDIQVCRKIVVADEKRMVARLSFLKPLEDFLANPPDMGKLFWEEMAKYLTVKEITFVRKVEEQSTSTEELIGLIPGVQ
jgi:hypothetical protein